MKKQEIYNAKRGSRAELEVWLRLRPWVRGMAAAWFRGAHGTFSFDLLTSNDHNVQSERVMRRVTPIRNAHFESFVKISNLTIFGFVKREKKGYKYSAMSKMVFRASFLHFSTPRLMSAFQVMFLTCVGLPLTSPIYYDFIISPSCYN